MPGQRPWGRVCCGFESWQAWLVEEERPKAWQGLWGHQGLVSLAGCGQAFGFHLEKM